ncbi:MAG: hypothetical protein OHK0052_04740 [Anaerolineales bacterium]
MNPINRLHAPADLPKSRSAPVLRLEHALFTALLLLAFVSRLSALGARALSHDETQHTYFAWQFAQGNGYTHTPLTHGPLQFHLIAAAYSLFGDNDATSRLPHALLSAGALGLLWYYRPLLSRRATLAAALLYLTSPYLLYYGRYARNEALIMPLALLMWLALLRYLQHRQPRHLLWFVLANALHFTAKETAFIYAAQVLFFLGCLTLWGLWRTRKPQTPRDAAPPIEIQPPSRDAASPSGNPFSKIRAQPAFDAALVLATLILPMFAAIPTALAGWDPLDYTPLGQARTGIFIIALTIIAAAVGLWWNKRLWLACAAVFYLPFTLFYTTLFTYAGGFYTGLVGSLGYWLSQQGVARGGQPWYYYVLIQLPLYEFTAVLASFLAFVLLLKRWRTIGYAQKLSLGLLLYWGASALLAYSLAGEKMPWLTVHITLPLILAGGWGLANLRPRRPLQGALLAVFGGLILLSGRAAFGAAYLRPHDPREFLVYAHSAEGNTRLAAQLRALSLRLRGDLSLPIAYDNRDGSGDPASAWPLTWYLRHFENTRTFGPEDFAQISREYPVIIASDVNWTRLEPLLAGRFTRFEFTRTVWAMEDYKGLTWVRLQTALQNPQMWRALWEIWLWRDFTRYAALTGEDTLTVENWEPSRQMRLYLRNDLTVWHTR